VDLDVRWEPRIGDPSVTGWLTVAAYFAAAVLCAAAARALRSRLPAAERRRQPAVWWGAALLLAALGVNKELDLQSWFTAVGRAVAERQGWIEQRREMQIVFIAVFTTTAAVSMGAAAWAIRRKWREYGPLLLGLGFVITFIVVRAASFHHVETFLDHRIGGARMNWVLELCGIASIALAAAARLRYARRRTGTGPA
jgi:hypothetical protein